jgi:hypothetical protein
MSVGVEAGRIRERLTRRAVSIREVFDEYLRWCGLVTGAGDELRS